MLWDLVEFHTNMRILWIIICESMIVYLYIKHLYVFNILAVWFVCNLDIVVDGTFEFAICTMHVTQYRILRRLRKVVLFPGFFDLNDIPQLIMLSHIFLSGRITVIGGSHCQPHIYLIIIKGHDKHTSWFYIWCGFKFNFN